MPVSHKILNIPSVNQVLQQTLSKELGISKVLSQILINRGINSLNEAQLFLKAKPGHMLDPFTFKDMHKAVELIKKAHTHKDKVMVFGDYDVDGLTGLALVEETLKKIGMDVTHYIPHRLKEGYGLSKNIAAVAKENNIKLLITVDCGTSGHKEVKELRQQGVEVIITDHHESGAKELPEANCLINPKVPGCSYKFRELAGAGVAFKLCQALTRSLMPEYLDMAALGTIADSVPLVGENRIIAKEGLKIFPETKRPGLKVLIDNAGINGRRFTSTFISFILAPRINASGRMDTAETSLKLLMSKSEEEAKGFAQIVEGHNRQRQKVESKILDEAKEMIEREINFKEQKIIVVAKEGWHHGVLGIVASKIADKFYRPAIVISLGEDSCKGSGRSIKNFQLFHALRDCQEHLDAFGGHAHAVGLVITKDNLEDFKRSINLIANDRLTMEDLMPSLDVDMEIELADLNDELVAELEQLEPFGKGNPEPLIYTRNLKLKGEPQVLARETLKFWVSDGNKTVQAIGFGMSHLKESLKTAEAFDLIYSPKVDSWNGASGTILEVRDIFFK